MAGEPVIPFLRSLAEQGLHFTEIFDATGEGRSSDADYLVMASQHPLERGAVSMTRPSLDMVALPNVLREHGYATYSAHAHNPGFWNAAARHRSYGFEISAFAPELGPGESHGFGLTDRAFFERVRPMIEGLPRPFLGWLITLTMHGPHGDVPPSFHTLKLGTLAGTPIGSYMLKARHTDDALRALTDRLDAAGVLAHTTLVVYGDHTESFGFDLADVRRRAGVLGVPEDVQRLIMDRIPLIVVPPGGGAGTTVAIVGSLLDVAPTVLHLLGLSAPRAFLGRSLLPFRPGVASQVSGEVVQDNLMWTGLGCYQRPGFEPQPPSACDELRARSRAELEVSWLITRYGLSPRLEARLPPRGAGSPLSARPKPTETRGEQARLA